MKQGTFVYVDPRSVLKMFAQLDSKHQKKAHKLAIKNGLVILQKESRKSLRSVTRKASSKNWWNGKSLSSGIRYSIDREVTSGKVHIMGDFRLKFFEMGTSQRWTTGFNNQSVRRKTPRWRQRKAANRGSINARHFFRTARENKEAEISERMNQILTQSILKVNGQFKNR